jgi:hypothetical protein
VPIYTDGKPSLGDLLVCHGARTVLLTCRMLGTGVLEPAPLTARLERCVSPIFKKI